MFNNCNPKTNGEFQFYNMIKQNINSIFDVGCRTDSEFLSFEGNVHYFDPVQEFIDKLKTLPNNNKISYFNNFGLGDVSSNIYYYPSYQSFYDRKISCKKSDEANKTLLSIQTGFDYVISNKINTIDFLKIDTEGYEFNVIKGFGDFLKSIRMIQFEYGGTYLDNQVKLIDLIGYLKLKGFHKFCYLTRSEPCPITDYNDHYQYCNIVCVNKESDYQPY